MPKICIHREILSPENVLLATIFHQKSLFPFCCLHELEKGYFLGLTSDFCAFATLKVRICIRNVRNLPIFRGFVQNCQTITALKNKEKKSI